MRPIAGEDPFLGRSRSTSFTDNATTPMPGAHQHPQMNYFLADEKTMEASLDRVSASQTRSRESMKCSNFGVESLETTTGSLTSQDNDDQGNRVGKARNVWKKSLAKGLLGNEEEDVSESLSPSPKSSRNASRDMSPSEPRRSRKASTSQSFTPLHLESPILSSIRSGLSSRRNSEAGFYTDDVASQAIVSSGDEDRDLPSEVIDSSSASQLVMPSLSMPSRRPFTEKGRNLGRLKILIAGDSGIGKTSLIRAIVQICDDIVHVDPLTSMTLSVSESRRRKSKTKGRSRGAEMLSTTQITEIYASTRSYPNWWSEFDDGKVMKRRKSSGDSVLERNLCFVDTPGYGNGTSCMESITPVVQYVESHLEKCSSLVGMSDSEMTGMISGNGGSLVDVIFYLILHRVKPVDIEYLRRLSPLTNVIPLIARADTLSSEQIEALKASTLSELQAANIRPFSFGTFPEDSRELSRLSPPFAISTIATSDDENMDASLLMSPDYVQPLMPTELTILVDQIFDRDHASWLRHSAARKCLQWRQGSSSSSAVTRSIPLALSTTSSSYSLVSRSQIVTPPIGATNTYTLARITDHTQREERLAQVRLSKWASDLQRSLQNERARFEALARGERAVWLTERLNECVQDGSIVPLSGASMGRRDSSSLRCGPLVKQGGSSINNCRRSAQTVSGRSSIVDRFDPLGLLHLNAEIRRGGWVALQIVGGVGILSGVAIWIARTVNLDGDGWAWGWTWGRVIGLEW